MPARPKLAPRGLPPRRRAARPAPGPAPAELRDALAERVHQQGVERLLSGDAAGALTLFKRVLELAPRSPEARYNVGQCLYELGRYAEAVPHLRDGAAGLGDPPADLDRPARLRHLFLPCFAALLSGDFATWRSGWRSASIRASAPPPGGLPWWGGRPLGPGATLLVRAGDELMDGDGDVLMLARFVPRLAGAAGRVVIECDPRLYPLLCTAGAPGIEWHSGHYLGPANAYTTLGMLPAILAQQPDDWQTPGPYLSADAALTQAWQGSLGDLEGVKVGFSWVGSKLTRSGRPAARRSIPPREFAALAAVRGVTLIALQLPGSPGWDDELPFDAISLPQQSEGAPFVHTASVLMNLDLVVTLDSAVGHLAGALGQPCWLALPHEADWRWLDPATYPDRTPWYPHHRLYRSPGDWSAVFARMAADLEELARCRR